MISPERFADALGLTVISPAPPSSMHINIADICRPGLQFAGYFDIFANERPQVIGKPEPAMALLAMERYGFAPEETVLLGDRVYTDIRCGISAGIDSVLVLSGESTMETVEEADVKPTMILRDVRELYQIMTED